MKRRLAALFVVPALTLWLSGPIHAQSEPSPGFTLTSSTSSTNTSLLDVSGATLHVWPDALPAGLAVYMLDNGNILRASTIPPALGTGGGEGGRIQEIAWDGNVVWTYDYASDAGQQHHDIEPMPNGNVLLVAWDNKTKVEAVAAGRNPATADALFQADHILEIEPTGPTSGNIVWEWRAWDHLIQDFDATKANFGVVADHPELIDLNYPPGSPQTGTDWGHMNSVDYNAELDQILVSIRNLDEVWIIDHSTTTAEAAGHTGGKTGKGGDLLYRWGNPAAYRAGPASAKILDGQHDANWVEAGYPGDGNITVFNNFDGGFFSFQSAVIEFTPPPVDASGNYPLTPGSAYEPAAPVWEYTAPSPFSFYNPFMGGAVRLPNGNTLICSSFQGWLFEVDPNKVTVWEKTGVGTPFKVRRYDRHLWTDGPSVSVFGGGSVDLEVVAGSEHAGAFFQVIGSASGTSPGVTFGGVHVPLNPGDAYWDLTVGSPGAPPLSQSFGLLDALGRATATFTLPPGSNPSYAGIELNHAFGVFNTLPGTSLPVLVSNPAPTQLLP